MTEPSGYELGSNHWRSWRGCVTRRPTGRRGKGFGGLLEGARGIEGLINDSFSYC